MNPAHDITRLERQLAWAVLAVCSPGLWLVAPIVIVAVLHGSPPPVPQHLWNFAVTTWVCGMGATLIASVIGAVAISALRTRIEARAQAALLQSIPETIGPLQAGTHRARVLRPGVVLIVRRLAPSHIRFVVRPLYGTLILWMIVSAIATGPYTRQSLLDLLLLFAIFTVFFGPASVLAGWTWTTRIQRTNRGLHISRSAGPWRFGPFRTRTQIVSEPCDLTIKSGKLLACNDEHEAMIVAYAPSHYGTWQVLRLGKWLSETLLIHDAQSH